MFLPAQNCNVNLGQDTNLCAASFTIHPNLSINQFEDSLEIIYDASQGQTGLIGASKVYMHSGAELVPFGGWQLPVGNWGQDDGIGEMSSLGNNRWRIRILPYQYYGFAQNTSINGIFMVFRNADGSAVGKDANGNDIWLDMTQSAPTSSFSGIQANWIKDALDSLLWSDGSTGSTLTVNSAGTYWLQMVDTSGCVAIDSIQIGLGSIPLINLGQPVICDGMPVVLDAGAGFANYAWSTGQNTQTITISSPSTVLVTVTNAQGCSGVDVVNVPAGTMPQASFVGNTFGSVGVNYVDASTGGGLYEWDFDGDGQTDDTSPGNVTHYFQSSGVYTTRLIVTNYCGADTTYQTVSPGITATKEPNAAIIKVFPNPIKDRFAIEIENSFDTQFKVLLIDAQGKILLDTEANLEAGKFKKEYEIEHLASGIYRIVLFNSVHSRSVSIQKI